MSYAADLSSFNAPADRIDWAQYIAWSKQGDGVSRLIIRACDGLVTDSNWLGYKQAAFDNGIDELYHYQFNNPDLNSPILEAEFLLNHALSSLRPTDSFMADYEKSVPQADGVWVVTWLERVMASIYPRMPVFYSYLSYINERLSGVTSLARFPLALADYSSQQPACPPPWTSYRWWQYSDRGSVPGIPGLIDVNQFFGGANVAVPSGPFYKVIAGQNGVPAVGNDVAAAMGLSWDDILGIAGQNPELAAYNPEIPSLVGPDGSGQWILLPGFPPQAAPVPPPALSPAEQAWLDVGPVFKGALAGI